MLKSLLKLYRARKHKTHIAIHFDLTKCCYLLLKDAYGKDLNKCPLCCADINFSLFTIEEW